MIPNPSPSGLLQKSALMIFDSQVDPFLKKEGSNHDGAKKV